jgi:uncharacterized protein (DUF2384 family)
MPSWGDGAARAAEARAKTVARVESMAIEVWGSEEAG